MSKQQKSAQGTKPITDELSIPATAFRVSPDSPPSPEDFAGTAGKPQQAMHREVDKELRAEIDKSLAAFPKEKASAFSAAPVKVMWNMQQKMHRNILLNEQGKAWLDEKTKKGEFNPKTLTLVEEPIDVPAGSTIKNITFHKKDDALAYYKVKRKLEYGRLEATRKNLEQMREGEDMTHSAAPFVPRDLIDHEGTGVTIPTRGARKWYDLLVDASAALHPMFKPGKELIENILGGEETPMAKIVKKAYRKGGPLEAMKAGGQQYVQEIKDTWGAYWDPQTTDEATFSAITDIGITAASFLVPPLKAAALLPAAGKVGLGARIGSQLVRGVKSAAQPVNWIRAQRYSSGLKALREGVLDPLVGRERLSPEEAKKQLEERGLDVLGKSDMDNVRMARGINALEGETQFLRGAAMATDMFGTRLKTQMGVGALQALLGLADFHNLVKDYTELAPKYMAGNDDLQKAMFKDLNSYKQALDFSSPQNWEENIARQIGGAAVMLGPYMYNLRALGAGNHVNLEQSGKNFFRLLTHPKLAKEVATKWPRLRALGAVTDDLATVTFSAFATALASQHEGILKKGKMMYDIYKKEGLSTGHAILASYGSEFMAAGIENLTEAGIVPSFVLSKHVAGKLMRETGKKLINIMGGEWAEEGVARVGQYVVEELAGTPRDYRQQLQKPFLINPLDMHALEDALGDFVTVAATAPLVTLIGGGGAMLRQGPRATLNKIIQEHRNQKVDPLIQAEQLTLEHYDPKHKDASESDRETFKNTLSNIIAHHMTGKSAKKNAEILSESIRAFGDPALIDKAAERAVERETHERLMDEDAAYYFNKRFATKVIEDTKDEEARIKTNIEPPVPPTAFVGNENAPETNPDNGRIPAPDIDLGEIVAQADAEGGIFRDRPVEKPVEPRDGPAMYTDPHGVEFPVMVAGVAGEQNGETYVFIEGSNTALPLSQIRYDIPGDTMDHASVTSPAIAQALTPADGKPASKLARDIEAIQGLMVEDEDAEGVTAEERLQMDEIHGTDPYAYEDPFEKRAREALEAIDSQMPEEPEVKPDTTTEVPAQIMDEPVLPEVTPHQEFTSAVLSEMAQLGTETEPKSIPQRGREALKNVIRKKAEGYADNDVVTRVLDYIDAMPEQIFNYVMSESRPEDPRFGVVTRLSGDEISRDFDLTPDESAELIRANGLIRLVFGTTDQWSNAEAQLTPIHEITHVADLVTQGTDENMELHSLLRDWLGTETGRQFEKELTALNNYAKYSPWKIEAEALAWIVSTHHARTAEGIDLAKAYSGQPARILQLLQHQLDSEKASEESRTLWTKLVDAIKRVVKLSSATRGKNPPNLADIVATYNGVLQSYESARSPKKAERTIANNNESLEMAGPEIKLTKEQSEAVTNIIAALDDPTKPMIGLRGAAGTGKTTAMKSLVEQLEKKGKTVALTVPTNKAGKILAKKTQRNVQTIHQMLHIAPQWTTGGFQKFARSTQTAMGEDAVDPMEGIDVVITDEASMIDYELFGYMQELQIDYPVKVVFVGDHYQAAPVARSKDDPSQAFNEPAMYGNDVDIVAELKTVMRQAGGNKILDLVTQLRNNIKTAVYGNDMIPYDNGPGMFDRETGQGVMFVNSPTTFSKILTAKFTSPQYRDDPDYCRVICYKNATVARWNSFIRNAIMGPLGKAEPFIGRDDAPLGFGDRVILNTPLIKDSNIVASVSTEFEVLSSQVTEDKLPFGEGFFEFEVNNVELQYEDMAGEIQTTSMKIITDSNSNGIKAFQAMKQYALEQKSKAALERYGEIRSQYMVMPLDTRDNTYKMPFRNFKTKSIELWNEKTDLNYAYALTIHKSQGSTFRGAFVVHDDLDVHRKSKPGGRAETKSSDEEINRLLYTAMTRPSHALIMYYPDRKITMDGADVHLDAQKIHADHARNEEDVIVIPYDEPISLPAAPPPSIRPEPEPIIEPDTITEPIPSPINERVKEQYRRLTFAETLALARKYPMINGIMRPEIIRAASDAYTSTNGDVVAVVLAMIEAHKAAPTSFQDESLEMADEDPLMAEFRRFVADVTGEKLDQDERIIPQVRLAEPIPAPMPEETSEEAITERQHRINEAVDAERIVGEEQSIVLPSFGTSISTHISGTVEMFDAIEHDAAHPLVAFRSWVQLIGLPLDTRQLDPAKFTAIVASGNARGIYDMLGKLLENPTEEQLGMIWEWTAANAGKQFIPRVAVTTDQKGVTNIRVDRHEFLDEHGKRKSTWQRPPGISNLGEIEDFYEKIGTVDPSGQIGIGPVVLLDRIDDTPVGEWCESRVETEPAAYGAVIEALAAQGIIVLGPGGKSKAFTAIVVDPNFIKNGNVPYGREAWVRAYEQFLQRKEEQDPEGLASVKPYLDGFAEVMKSDEPLTPMAMTYAIRAAFLEHLFESGWVNTKNSDFGAYKYFSLFSATDIAPMMSMAGLVMANLRKQLERQPADRKEAVDQAQIRQGLERAKRSDREDDQVAQLEANGFDVYEGGLAHDPVTNKMYAIVAVTNHDFYYQGKEAGDGAALIHPLLSAVYDMLTGSREHRVKRHKVRIFQTAKLGLPVLFKGMFFPTNIAQNAWMRKLNLGMILPASVVKLGAGQIRMLTNTETFPTMQQLIAKAHIGDRSGLAIGLIQIENVVKISDAMKSAEKHTTSAGNQTWLATTMNKTVFPHLKDTWDAIRTHLERSSRRSVRKFMTMLNHPEQIGVLYRSAGNLRTSELPKTRGHAVLAKLADVGRDMSRIFATPFFSVVTEGAPLHQLLDDIGDSANGTRRTLGGGLFLAPDFGIVDQTSIVAVLESAAEQVPTVEFLSKYFDVTEIKSTEDLGASEEFIKYRESVHATIQRLSLRGTTNQLTDRESETLAGARQAADELAKDNGGSVLGSMAVTNGWVPVVFKKKTYYFKGSGLMKHYNVDNPNAVNVVVSRDMAEKYGWKNGDRVLGSAIPSDAAHSTVPMVIIGIDNVNDGQMTWSVERTVKLGKDHDGDTIYVFGVSTGYWKREADKTKMKLLKSQDPKKIKELRDDWQYAKMMQIYGHLETSQEFFDLLFTYFSDPKVQNYMTDLYKKVGITDPFDKEADAFIRNAGMFAPADPRPVLPIEPVSDMILTDKYQGAAKDLIGMVAYTRNLIEYLVQNAERLSHILDPNQMVTVSGKRMKAIDAINLANALLTNHSVDVPAKENIFGVKYDMTDHLVWAVKLLTRPDLKETKETAAATFEMMFGKNPQGMFMSNRNDPNAPWLPKALDPIITGRVFFKGKASASQPYVQGYDGRKLPLNVRLEAAILSNLQSQKRGHNALFDAMLSGMRDMKNLGMSPDWYRERIAGDMVRGMAQRLFGVSEIWDSSPRATTPGALREGEADTMLGIWRRNVMSGDQSAWDAAMLMHWIRDLGSLYEQYGNSGIPAKVLHRQLEDMTKHGQTFFPMIAKRMAQLLRQHSEQYTGQPFVLEAGRIRLEVSRGSVLVTTPISPQPTMLEAAIEEIVDPTRLLAVYSKLPNQQSKDGYMKIFHDFVDLLLDAGAKLQKKTTGNYKANILDNTSVNRTMEPLLQEFFDKYPNSQSSKMLQTLLLSEDLFLIHPVLESSGLRDLQIWYNLKAHHSPLSRAHHAGVRVEGILPRTFIAPIHAGKDEAKENQMNTMGLQWIQDDDVLRAMAESLGAAPGLRSWYNIEDNRREAMKDIDPDSVQSGAEVMERVEKLRSAMGQINQKVMPNLTRIIQLDNDVTRAAEQTLGTFSGRLASLLKLLADTTRRGHTWIDQNVVNDLRRFNQQLSASLPLVPQAAYATARMISAGLDVTDRALSHLAAKIESMQGSKENRASRWLRSKGIEGKHPGLQPILRFSLTERFGPNIPSIIDYGISEGPSGPIKHASRRLGNDVGTIHMHSFEVNPRGKTSVSVPIIDFVQAALKNFRDFKDVAKTEFLSRVLNNINGLSTNASDFRQFNDKLAQLFNLNGDAKLGRIYARIAFEQMATMELHTGELWPEIKLLNDRGKWIWDINGTKYTEAQHTTVNEMFWNSLVTPAIANSLGGRALAREVLKTVMQTRHAIATNNWKVYNAKLKMHEHRLAFVTDLTEHQKLLGEISGTKQLMKRIATGEHYMPLFYQSMIGNGMGVVEGESEQDRFIDLYTATFALSSKKVRAAYTAGKIAEDQIPNIHTAAMVAFIEEHDIEHTETVRRIMRETNPRKRMETAREEMRILLDKDGDRMIHAGSEFGFSGFDMHTNTRMVDMKLLSAHDDMRGLTLLDKTLPEYLDINLGENLEQMYQNHAESLFQTYTKTLTAEFIDPFRANAHHPGVRKALRSWDRWLNGVMHQRIFSKHITPSRLVKGDDVNLHYKDTYTFDDGTQTKIVRRLPARYVGKSRQGGVEGYEFVYQSEDKGPQQAFYNADSGKLTFGDATYKFHLMATFEDDSVVKNMLHRYAQYHFPFGGYMYAKVAPGVELAGKIANTVVGAMKLLYAPASAMKNATIFLKNSLLWYNMGSVKGLKGLIDIMRAATSEKKFEYVVQAMGSLPIFVWDHVAGRVSEGAEIKDKSVRGFFRSAMYHQISRMQAIETMSGALPLDNMRRNVALHQKQFELYSQHMAKYAGGIWSYITSKEGAKHLYDVNMLAGYKMFGMAESFNRRTATITALMNSNNFLNQNFDLDLRSITGEHASVGFRTLPPEIQNQMLRWWVSNARQQDDGINFDYSNFMRPRWLRQPWMQFFAKFSTFAMATWTHRARMFGDAWRYMFNKDWKLGAKSSGKSVNPFFRKQLDVSLPIDITRVPEEQWRQFETSALAAFAGTVSAEEIMNKVKKDWAEKGIVLEKADMSQAFRAVMYTFWTMLEASIAARIGWQLGFMLEAPSQMLASMLDLVFNLSGWDGDDDDEKKAYRNLSPYIRKLRGEHIESLLSDIFRNSPLPAGMVFSSLLSKITRAIFEPQSGRTPAVIADEVVRDITRITAVREFMEMIKTTYPIYQHLSGRKAEKNWAQKDYDVSVADRGMEMFDWSYTRAKLMSQTEAFDKQMESLSRPDPSGRATKFNAYKDVAIYNVEQLNDYREGFMFSNYIYDFKKWKDQYTSDDGGKSQHNLEIVLERARLGDPEAYEFLEKKIDNVDEAISQWAKEIRDVSEYIYNEVPGDLEDISRYVPDPYLPL